MIGDSDMVWTIQKLEWAYDFAKKVNERELTNKERLWVKKFIRLLKMAKEMQ